MDDRQGSALPWVTAVVAALLLLAAATSDHGSPAAVLVLMLAALLYFLPSIVGSQRNCRNIGSVVVINLLLGWTLVGWVIAMAMALASRPAEHAPEVVPPQAATRDCPFCAEPIKVAAIRCKHCGADVTPIPPNA